MKKITDMKHDNNSKHRETGSSVRFGVCSYVLTLVLALTMALSGLLQTGSLAFAASWPASAEETSGTVGTTTVKFMAEGGTSKTKAYVATYKQLKAALDQGYSEIIIDPDAAQSLTDNTNSEGKKEAVTYSGDFYIPIEEPLTVSHDTTIRSAEGVSVKFARSANGGTGTYDSKAFSGVSEATPALFNVGNNVSLTVDGDITMTGEEVSAVFEDSKFEFTVNPKDGSDKDSEVWKYGADQGSVAKGGYFLYAKGGDIVLNEDVLLTGLNTDEGSKDIAPVYIDGSNKEASVTIDGAEITGNDLGSDPVDKDAASAGAIKLLGAKASAKLVSGEISDNRAEAAGVLVASESTITTDNDFVIDEADIYYEATAEKETAVEDATDTSDAEKESSAEETTVEETPAPAVTQKKSVARLSAPRKAPASSAKKITSLEDLKAAIAAGGTYELEEGVDITIDVPLVVNKDITINGTGTIRRTKDMGTDPMFTVKNGKTLELGTGVTLSGIPGKTKTVPIYGESTDYVDPTTLDNLNIADPVFGGRTGRNAISYTLANYRNNNASGKDQQTTAGGSRNGFYLYAGDDANGVAQFWALPSADKIQHRTSGNPVETRHSVQLVKVTGADKSAGTSAMWDLYGRLVWKIGPDMNDYTDGWGSSTAQIDYDYNRKCSYAIWNETTGEKLYLYERNGVMYAGTRDNNYLINGSSSDGGYSRWKSTYSEDNVDDNFTQTCKLVWLNEATWMSTYNYSLHEDNSGSGSGSEIIGYKTVTDTVDNAHLWSQNDAPSGTSAEPKGFFVQVETGGTLKIEGATLKDYKTVSTYDKDETDKSKVTPVWNAPVAVKGTFEMSAGSITNNTVGYGADENDSQKSVQILNQLVRDTDPTNTAGAVIFSGSSATGTLSGSAVISRNQADAGAMIITDGAKVTMDDSDKDTDGKYKLEIKENVGWHHSGAVLVEKSGTFHLKDGSINNNVAWYKGGAVWATRFGTTGLVRWDRYPNTMTNYSATDIEALKDKDGKFIMEGGELKENFAFARGGALEVESDGVQLIGGEITGNMSKSLGGGIYVEGDSPIYTFTLNIKNGYISENESVAAVADTRLDKKITNGLITGTGASTYGTDGLHRDGDWANWGAVHTGDGGGVWLCSMGGTAVFTAPNAAGDQVIIDNNTAARVDGQTPTNNGWGDDMFISHRSGSALIQNLAGNWVGDDEEEITGSTRGIILKGPRGMYNKGKDKTGNNPYTLDDAKGIIITDNVGRNGGGIAANGTLILGKASSVYEYDAELDIEKKWAGSLTGEEVTLDLYYTYNGQSYKLNSAETSGGSKNAAYSVTLGGADTATIPDGNDVMYKTGKWTAKALLPAFTRHKIGDTETVDVPLYKIIKSKNGSNTVYYNLDDMGDVKELWDYINGNGTGDVELDIEWNIEIRERSGKFVLTPGEATAKASNQLLNSVDLKNPDDGSDLDSFSINLVKITFDQEVENSLKNTNVELYKTKVNGNVINANPNATFAIYETNKTTAELFNADGTINPKDKKNEDQDITLKPIVNDEKGLIRTNLTVANDGKLTINDLPANKVYLLFEKSAPSGYVRSQKPWLLHVKKDGTYDLFYYDSDTIKGGSADVTPDAGESNSVLRDRWWQGHNFKKVTTGSGVAAGKALANSKDIQITKVYGVVDDNNTLTRDESTKIAGAEFNIYETSGKWVRGDQIGETFKSDSNGVITLPNYVASQSGDKNYWIEEVKAAPGYKKADKPWIIWVQNGELVHIYRFKAYDGSGSVKEGDLIRSIVKNGTVVGDNDFDSYKEDVAYIHNEPETIELTKVNENGVAISGAKASYSTDEDEDDENRAKFVITDAAKGNWWYVPLTRPKDSNKTGYDENATILSKARKDASGNVIYYETDDEGKIQIDNLPAGSYFLFETKAPLGFARTTTPWLIEVSNGPNGRTWNVFAIKDDYRNMAIVDDDPKTESEIAEDDTKLVSRWWDDGWFDKSVSVDKLVNEPKHLLKVDLKPLQADSNATPEGLSGATFKLYRARLVKESKNGTSWFVYLIDNLDGGAEYDLECDSQGRIVLPSEVTTSNPNSEYYNRIVVEGLKVAKNYHDTWKRYRTGDRFLLFEQTAPVGYEKSETPYLISVDKGNISVQRYDKAELDASYVQGEDGHQLFNDLPDTPCWMEKPFLTEAWSSKGYVTNTKVDVQLTKVDGFNPDNKLAGAQFAVYGATKVSDSDGAWVYELNKNVSYGNTSKSSRYSTNKGVFTLPSRLADILDTEITDDDGKVYFLDEIAEPSGYEKSKTPFAVLITKNTDTDPNAAEYVIKAFKTTATENEDEYTFNNQQSDTNEDFLDDKIPNYKSINLKKVDLTTVDVLEGSSEGHSFESIGTTDETVYLSGIGFKLHKADDDWKRTERVKMSDEDEDGNIFTDKNGKLELGALADGNYLLEETITRSDYVRPAKDWRIVVEDGVATVSVSRGEEYKEIIPGSDGTTVITNSPVYDLPSAGGMGTYWFSVIGALMMGFALTAALTRMTVRKRGSL